VLSIVHVLEQGLASKRQTANTITITTTLHGYGPILPNISQLIVQLYQPGAPETIAKTQETLQKLQRSPQGWQLANSLASHENEQVRFFAALTFIVKLNTDA
jgi:hypothetical protein